MIGNVAAIEAHTDSRCRIQYTNRVAEPWRNVYSKRFGFLVSSLGLQIKSSAQMWKSWRRVRETHTVQVLPDWIMKKSPQKSTSVLRNGRRYCINFTDFLHGLFLCVLLNIII